MDNKPKSSGWHSFIILVLFVAVASQDDKIRLLSDLNDANTKQTNKNFKSSDSMIHVLHERIQILENEKHR